MKRICLVVAVASVAVGLGARVSSAASIALSSHLHDVSSTLTQGFETNITGFLLNDVGGVFTMQVVTNGLYSSVSGTQDISIQGSQFVIGGEKLLATFDVSAGRTTDTLSMFQSGDGSKLLRIDFAPGIPPAPAPAPEPGSALLVGLGLTGLFFCRRRVFGS